MFQQSFHELFYTFFQESETKEVKVAVNGKRRRELGLVVPGKYCARTENKRTVKILEDRLKIIKEMYTHFEIYSMRRARNVIKQMYTQFEVYSIRRQEM